MSEAYQCDVCGQLYEPTPGAIRMDVYRHNGSAFPDNDSWSDVDLCVTCTNKVIEIIRPALLEYPK